MKYFLLLSAFVAAMAVQPDGYAQLTLDKDGDLEVAEYNELRFMHFAGGEVDLRANSYGFGIFSFSGKKLYFSTSENQTSSTARIIITPDGNVGIGAWDPTYKLQVAGSAAKNDGSSLWNTYSDRRLKDIRGDYAKGLEEVIKLQPISFRYKQGNPLDLPSDADEVGFVAQDLQKVFPEAVGSGKDGYLDVNMHAVNMAVINAIKELYEENRALREEIAALKSALKP